MGLKADIRTGAPLSFYTPGRPPSVSTPSSLPASCLSWLPTTAVAADGSTEGAAPDAELVGRPGNNSFNARRGDSSAGRRGDVGKRRRRMAARLRPREGRKKERQQGCRYLLLLTPVLRTSGLNAPAAGAGATASASDNSPPADRAESLRGQHTAGKLARDFFSFSSSYQLGGLWLDRLGHGSCSWFPDVSASAPIRSGVPARRGTYVRET